MPAMYILMTLYNYMLAMYNASYVLCIIICQLCIYASYIVYVYNASYVLCQLCIYASCVYMPAMCYVYNASYVQQIAVILQQEIQNCKTNIYIASFQVAQLQSHLKGGYVNFGFAVLDFMLQDHCNLLYICQLCTMYCRFQVGCQKG